MDTIEEAVIRVKRTELSKFCLDGCTKNCCIFEGLSISVDEGQLKLLYGAQLKAAALSNVAAVIGCEEEVNDHLFRTLTGELEKRGVLKEEGEQYTLYNTTCPQYDEETKKCRVHDNPNRPRACEPFPITLNDEKEVVLDTRCSFVYRHWEDIISSLTMNRGENTPKFKLIAPFIGGIFPYDADIYKKMRDDGANA